VGLIVIVAAHVADKKLENYAFQQQLTLFFKIHCAKKKKAGSTIHLLSLELQILYVVVCLPQTLHKRAGKR